MRIFDDWCQVSNYQYFVNFFPFMKMRPLIRDKALNSLLVTTPKPRAEVNSI